MVLLGVLFIDLNGWARGEILSEVSGSTGKPNTFASVRKLIETGSPERALEELKSSNKRYHKNSDYYFLEGRAYQDKRENTMSLISYTISVYIDPGNYRAYINRALVRGALGDLKGSLDDLDSAIKINPESAPALMNRGVTRAALNKPYDALRDFTAAIKIDAYYADAYRNRGITFNYIGQRDKACSDWKKAIELKQVDVHLWYQQLCRKSANAASDAPRRTGVRGIQ